MSDFHSILNRLLPIEDGEPPVRYRKGVVVGTGSGVVDVAMSGVTVPDVPIHGSASVSDEVHLLVWRGDLLAIGQDSGGGGGGCSSCDLGDLADVNLAGLSDGDVIVWDATGGEWVPSAPADAATITSQFSQMGPLTVTAGSHKLPWSFAATILSCQAAVGVAPTGDDVIVDVNLNGTTIYTTQANRPVVADGAAVGTATVPDVTSIAIGDYLTVDIDQVGSSDPGEDLTVVVAWRAN